MKSGMCLHVNHGESGKKGREWGSSLETRRSVLSVNERLVSRLWGRVGKKGRESGEEGERVGDSGEERERVGESGEERERVGDSGEEGERVGDSGEEREREWGRKAIYNVCVTSVPQCSGVILIIHASALELWTTLHAMHIMLQSCNRIRID